MHVAAKLALQATDFVSSETKLTKIVWLAYLQC